MICLALGDSLAVGVGHALPECQIVAEVGISATTYARRFLHPRTGYDAVLISLGSNPGPNDDIALTRVRSMIDGPVIWLLPPGRERDLVRTMAAQYGDAVVDMRISGATPVKIHPDAAGYKRVAAAVRDLMTGSNYGFSTEERQ